MKQKNKDVQPQAEPYIVKSHDIHIDADYVDWIADIKHRYRSAQVKAAVKVNAEKLLFNWQLGCDLVQKKAEERWGAGVVEQVSMDLNREFPDSTNFSVRNLWYMKQWYQFYAEDLEKLKQLVSVMLPDDSYDKKSNLDIVAFSCAKGGACGDGGGVCIIDANGQYTTPITLEI